jgi:hypothetical protein
MGKTRDQLRDEIDVFVLTHAAHHGHGVEADRAVTLLGELNQAIQEDVAVAVKPAPAAVAPVEDLADAEKASRPTKTEPVKPLPAPAPVAAVQPVPEPAPAKKT